MDILQNIKLFGNFETNSIQTKDEKVHALTATDGNYILDTSTHMKHILDLENAPTKVTVTLAGGDEDDLMGIIVIKQSSISTKEVFWDAIETPTFPRWRGALNKYTAFVYHYVDGEFINLSPPKIKKHDLAYVEKSFSTTTANTTVSLLDASYAVINLTQISNITFTDLLDGVEYTVIINRPSVPIDAMFPNLEISSNIMFFALGVGKNILKIIKGDDNNNVYLMSANTRP